MKEKRILFVCRYNRFRSVIAEAYFKKYNKNKNIKVKSAGPIRGRPSSKNVAQIAKERGLKIKKKTEGLTSELMKWQNITVIVADDVPPTFFDKNKEYGKKVICWKIPDVKRLEKDVKQIRDMRKISDKIEKRVKKLVEDLK